MHNRPKNMTRDRERTIRPVLRQHLGRAVYLEARLVDLGKILGLPKRSHPKWGPNHAAEFISVVGAHSQLPCSPLVCQVTEAFLIEARRIRDTFGDHASSTAKSILLSQFLAFRASQLGEIFRLGCEFVPDDAQDEVLNMLVAACDGLPGDRLYHYRRLAEAA